MHITPSSLKKHPTTEDSIEKFSNLLNSPGPSCKRGADYGD